MNDQRANWDPGALVGNDWSMASRHICNKCNQHVAAFFVGNRLSPKYSSQPVKSFSKTG